MNETKISNYDYGIPVIVVHMIKMIQNEVAFSVAVAIWKQQRFYEHNLILDVQIADVLTSIWAGYAY